VCGPSIDIASSVADVRIDAVTICEAQARSAAALIREAGLSGRIHVQICDFHRLPFKPQSFDVVLFFESFGYSYDLRRVLEESFRVTRPGGTLYIKEVFRRGHPLSVKEHRELAEFNRTFAFDAPVLSEAAAAAQAAGYRDVRQVELTPWMSTAHNIDAMFEVVDGRPQPTDFGERHFRVYECLPVFFAEVKATRPESGERARTGCLGSTRAD
jgi:ubiquinone/menaquinone biosynthesis C-methylase UbiE